MLSMIRNAIGKLRTIGAERAEQSNYKRQMNAIQDILLTGGCPDTSAAERDFQALSMEYHGPGQYEYDARASWLRGATRAQQLLTLCPDIVPGDQVLEVACGDGMTSKLLQCFGVQPMLTDLDDWRDTRAKDLRFVDRDLSSARDLPAGDVGLAFSYNAFEHFPDPARALELMLGSVRVGGYLFVEFGPLYAGPWGLHAYRTLPMPFPQFLFSETFWRGRLGEKGVKDLGREMRDLQPLNAWSLKQFECLFRNAGCELCLIERMPAQNHVDLVFRYPQSFRGRGLTLEDLRTHGLRVLLRKV